MRERVLVVSADLRQLMDLAVALRGDNFAPILVHCEDVLDRAFGVTEPAIVCLSGSETAVEIGLYLQTEPAAVILAPANGLELEACAVIEHFEAPWFEHDAPPIVVIAAMTATAHALSLTPLAPSAIESCDRGATTEKQEPWQR